MKKIKNYILPFFDYVLSILISMLFTAFFSSWFKFRPFAYAFGVIMFLVMCGFVYSRFWKISRKNFRYQEGLTQKDIIKFSYPLVLFCALITLVYVLADCNVIPLKSIVTKIYYTFPDGLPREMVKVTAFDRYNSFIRICFSHLLALMKTTNAYLLILSTLATFGSAFLGTYLGFKNKEVLTGYVKATDKIKDKFNE